MGFCMDKHEYPNQLGVVPAVMISFTRSEALCAAEGKRLCFDSEWTFACRSTTELPGCNVGHSIAPVIPRRFWDPSAVASELERVDARRVSQATTCATPAGIFDLPGNVREWVRSEHVAQYPAAIKGPGYNESSIDCERSIQTRLPEQAYPHTGLRCCTEPLVAVPGGP
jgi:formylglycine-generating enzyme required for sulfatase activity